MSIFDNIINQEVSNGTLEVIPDINPSLTPIESHPPAENLDNLIAGTNPNNIRDKRVAADTGKLVHNWWISYMKSLKKFFNDTFDDSIVHYEFNYASKSMLLKRLYSNIQQENPSCIINLESFQTDNNLDPQRRNSGFYNLLQTTPLCKNYTKTEEIFIDFKFVNLSQNIILNFNDSSDVLNYYDRLTTVYPLNINFISYDYRTFINVHAETWNWSIDDAVEGIIVDAAELGSDNFAGKNQWEEYLAPQRWAEYTSCPYFMINSINQMVDKQNDKYQLQISLTTILRVPQTLIVKAMDGVKIQAIQIVMDIADDMVDNANPSIAPEELKELDQNPLENIQAFKKPERLKTNYSDASFKPICIDIDRNIYASHKSENVLYLDPLINILRLKTIIYDNNGLETGTYINEGFLILPAHFDYIIENRGVALFIIQDSTISKPRMNWAELGILFKWEEGKPELTENSPERYYIKEFWTQSEIDKYYSELESNDRPKIPEGESGIWIIKAKIPSFGEWSNAFDQIGPWFNIRLLTFHVNYPDTI